MLATFALGTAAGDLTAMSLNFGFLGSAVLFAVLIAIPALGLAAREAQPDCRLRHRLCHHETVWVPHLADWLSKPHSSQRALVSETGQ